MTKRKRPRDPNQLVKLIVDIATDEAAPEEEREEKGNPPQVRQGALPRDGSRSFGQGLVYGRHCELGHLIWRLC